MCPLYVAGLIGPGDRKSVQPMAERFAPGGYDRLHHFVAAGVWDAAPLETELLVQADKLVGGRDAVLVIDDTAMPKKGKHSVGVAPQYASALGKTANCQTLVSLTLARGEVPAMMELRLFLSQSWTSDRLIWPIAARGRPRRRHVPDILSMAAEDMLADARWQNISWRTGTKGKLKARFAAVRVRTADGPPQRIGDKGQQHLPGDEAWLIGEQRTSGEKKFYLANLPAETNLRTLAATIKARWICEQAHQQLKEELGLDHFEGRSWQGLHRHALMTMIAYAFLQHRRLASRAGKKQSTGRHLSPACPPCEMPSSA
jgi:SRSO17 transposase